MTSKLLQGLDIALIERLPLSEQKEILRLLTSYNDTTTKQAARETFIEYVKYMWRGVIIGRHHKKIAQIYDGITKGELKRVIINLPPRHTKSEFASWLFPSYYLGHHPDRKIMQICNVADLAEGFGRKVRDTIWSEEYQELFPDTKVSKDARAARRWVTRSRGEYFATGTGGALAGRGANHLNIDDPHALDISTPIPTPNGFVCIGDLKVGDQVFGADGYPTTVIAKSPVWERLVYTAETSDGAEVDCDAEHLWTVRWDSKLAGTQRTVRAKEIVGKKVYLPKQGAAQYRPAPLPVDPWVLGAWLGDGTSSLGRMTAHPDDAPYMRRMFEQAGYITTDLEDPYSFGVKGLRAQLRDLGVLDNKHVPEMYLFGSPEQRLRFLQGLMDTDGTVNKNGVSVFSNYDKGLSEAVLEIVRSLGVKATISEQKSKGNFGSELKTDWRVVFTMKDSAYMPRKRLRTKASTRASRSMVIGEQTRMSRVCCIKVDREDGLFLAGRGYVVTHNSEQEAARAGFDSKCFDATWEWYNTGPRQRLQPGGSISIVQTRWGKKDLAGRAIQQAIDNGSINDWKIFNFPAIMPSGKPLWPEFWSLEELLKVKRDIPVSRWNAQYQQEPTSEEGALVKGSWWREWEREKLPEFEFIVQSWDTAFTKTNHSDFSACTTWGVFKLLNAEGRRAPQVMLLDAWQDRVEFPRLKDQAKIMYQEWQPDSVVVEGRASGQPLIFELRAMGLPVAEHMPARGNDKRARVNAISDMFSSGFVWFKPSKMAEHVIAQFSEFPYGDHDDLVDSSSQALQRLREGLLVGADRDSIDLSEDEEDRPRRRRFERIY